MALITDSNGYVAAGSTNTIISGRGSIIALLISHDQSSPQTVTLYDNVTASGTVLAQITVAAEQSPAWIRFADNYPLRFSDGLTVDPGTHCDVQVMAGSR